MKATKTLVCATFILTLTLTALAQDKGKWVFMEHKDPMTDQVSRGITLTANGFASNDFMLMVLKTPKAEFISISIPIRLSQRTVTVQYRVDDTPMVEETWTISDKIIISFNCQDMLKKMIAGKHLKVRFTGGGQSTSVLEYNISGLSYNLAKLGISLD